MEQEPEENQEGWSVTLIETCISEDTDLIKHCISQSTYNVIDMRIRNHTSVNCLYIDELEDLEGNPIAGNVRTISDADEECGQ